MADSTDFTALLTERDLLTLRDAFKVWEELPGDGRADRQEMGSLLRWVARLLLITLPRSFGIDLTDGELDKAMSELSADGIDTIEFPEFIKMISKKTKQKDSEEELRSAFMVLDEENTGRVRAEELKMLLVEMVGEQEQEVDAMIKEVKVDREGFINYNEFISLVMS